MCIRDRYTRLSLSDDPEARHLKQQILEGAKEMGLPPNMDMNIVFNNMTKAVSMMKKQIDSEV